MKPGCRWLHGLILLCLCAIGGSSLSQETVVIPKSRLAELERKEAELERLKSELQSSNASRAQTSNNPSVPASNGSIVGVQPKTDPPKTLAARVELPPARRPDSESSIASLPPLATGETVAATELLRHYLSAPSAARRRYEKTRIRVAGEIVGFDKPMLRRHADILLKPAEPGARIVCRLDPPADLPALFTARAGEELVGSSSTGARSILARVGQSVVIEAWCQGLKDRNLILTSAKLIQVR